MEKLGGPSLTPCAEAGRGVAQVQRCDARAVGLYLRTVEVTVCKVTPVILHGVVSPE